MKLFIIYWSIARPKEKETIQSTKFIPSLLYCCWIWHSNKTKSFKLNSKKISRMATAEQETVFDDIFMRSFSSCNCYLDSKPPSNSLVDWLLWRESGAMYFADDSKFLWSMFKVNMLRAIVMERPLFPMEFMCVRSL